MVEDEVRAMIVPGNKVRCWTGAKTDHPKSEIWHIRAIVDETQVVFRWWRRGRGWQYLVESRLFFEMFHSAGLLSLCGREKV